MITTAPKSPNTLCGNFICRRFTRRSRLGVASLMSAFNSLNGVPSSANPFTLETNLAKGVGLSRTGGQRLELGSAN